MARQGLERGLPLGFLVLLSTFANKFFDLSTPSMRKVDNGEKKRMVFKVATNIVASRTATDWKAARSCSCSEKGTCQHQIIAIRPLS